MLDHIRETQGEGNYQRLGLPEIIGDLSLVRVGNMKRVDHLMQRLLRIVFFLRGTLKLKRLLS